MSSPTVDALRRLAAEPEDTRAWEVLAAQQRKHLLAFAIRCCPDRHAAEDAVQEALILARRDADQFRLRPGRDGEQQARAWLAGIATNCARLQMRAAVRRAARHRRRERRALAPGVTIDPLVREETVRLIHAAVSALPAPTAQAVSLRYFEQLEYAGIAEALDISEAAARKRVQRGIGALRRRLRRAGCALGLFALIRHLRASGSAAPATTIPHRLFQSEMTTMPRISLIGGCAATCLATVLALSLFSPERSPTAEPPTPPEAESEPVQDPPDPHRAMTAEAAQAALVEGNTTFALELYRSVAGELQEDVVLSPASISQALALVEAGARGATRAEFRDTLHWDGLGDHVHPAWRRLREHWNDAEGIELAVANRLYSQRGDPFKPAFLALCRRDHQAEARASDFVGDPNGERRAINAWVGEQTQGRIPELLEAGTITTRTRSVLVNACYFKGRFLSPFEAIVTREGTPFHAADGVVTCAMMRQQSTFLHAADDRVDVVRLAYGDREAGQPSAYLTLVVPKRGDGLAAIEAALDRDQLATWSKQLAPKRVALGVPRFTSRTPMPLGDVLQSLGLRQAFNQGADFSGMKDGTFLLGEVVHEAWIATDESGSEAAAATAAIMPTGVRPQAQVRVTADRPFLWMITDVATESLIFIGRVAKPEDPGPAEPVDR